MIMISYAHIRNSAISGDARSSVGILPLCNSIRTPIAFWAGLVRGASWSTGVMVCKTCINFHKHDDKDVRRAACLSAGCDAIQGIRCVGRRDW